METLLRLYDDVDDLFFAMAFRLRRLSRRRPRERRQTPRIRSTYAHWSHRSI